MSARIRRLPMPVIAVMLLMLTAYILRLDLSLFPSVISGNVSNLLRTAIYNGILLVWGISVCNRLLHPQIRRITTAIAVLMIFWMTVRCVRFLSPPPAIMRWCWYLYYIPILFIHLLAVLCTMLLARPESFTLPKWTILLYFAAGAVALFVLTNDLHQLVFVFPEGIPNDGEDYRYGIGFIVPAVWNYAGLLIFFVMLVCRSRVPGKGKRMLLPLFFSSLLLIYHIIYQTEANWLRVVLGDMTAVHCMLVISILESCMRCGLICVNTDYQAMFRIMSGGAAILDEEHNVRIASDEYTPIAREIVLRAEKEPVLLENGMRVSSAPIRGGSVVWTEDVSGLSALIAELDDRRGFLAEQVLMLQKEVETRQRSQRIYEQNRLFGKVIGEMQKRIELFSSLIDDLEGSSDSREEQLLTTQLALICTQLKRSVNLVFIEETEGSIEAGELLLAVQEWLVTLRIAGVQCDCCSSLESPVAFRDVLTLYDLLTRILLTSVGGMQTLFIRISEADHRPYLTLDIGCGADLSVLESPEIAAEQESDREWSLTVRVPEGGAV